jgi:DNA-damage-inducible protein J
MAKTETLRIRVEPSLKSSAEHIFAALGLSASDAITIFYRQVELNQGLPFAVQLPNATTQKAMRETLEGKHIRTQRSLSDLKKKFT